MKEESPEQFYDTVKLFDYGFTNFSVVNVAENETNYSIRNSNFFHTSSDVFGNSNPILSLNQDSYLIMPKTTVFDELDSEISYDTEEENEVAIINYYYHGAYVGTATVDLADEKSATYDFTENVPEETEKEPNIIIVNIKIILIAVLSIAALFIAFFVIRAMIDRHNFLYNRRTIKKRRKKIGRRKDGPHFPSSGFDDFNF